MAVSGEPILSRIHRLDGMLKQLEEIKLGGIGDDLLIHHTRPSLFVNKSSASSEPSTPSSVTDGGRSSSDFSPRSLHKHCRPIDTVILEAETKGTLIERLDHIEDRFLKLCMQMEEELEAERQKEDHHQGIVPTATENDAKVPPSTKENKKKKKGFKHMVKKFLVGGVPPSSS